MAFCLHCYFLGGSRDVRLPLFLRCESAVIKACIFTYQVSCLIFLIQCATYPASLVGSSRDGTQGLTHVRWVFSSLRYILSLGRLLKPIYGLLKGLLNLDECVTIVSWWYDTRIMATLIGYDFFVGLFFIKIVKPLYTSNFIIKTLFFSWNSYLEQIY